MTRTPLVSVLLTAYNRERYLSASIESVLGQTFQDFELIVVDDGSTDGTVHVARTYEKLDPRVRVFGNERNLGDYGNRNRAAQLARGSLLKYHDSDDVMYAHCLAVMVPMLLAEPRAGLGLSVGWCWPGGPCPMLLTPRMAYQREFLGAGLFLGGPSSAIFRREVFHELGGFVDEGAPSDHFFWMRACARVNVLLLPADLFWYRTHAGQELQSVRAQREYGSVLGAEWRMLHAPECPLTAEEREQAKRNCAYGIAKTTYRDIRAGRWSIAWLRLATSGLTPLDFVKYLRRARRTHDAGTPTADGDYVMPPGLVGRS